MLWMLGLAAIVVDVVSRFFVVSDHNSTTVNTTTVVNPHPRTLVKHISLVSPPEQESTDPDVTYIVINEKNPELPQDLLSNVLEANQIEVLDKADLSESIPSHEVKRMDNIMKASDVTDSLSALDPVSASANEAPLGRSVQEKRYTKLRKH